MNKFAMVFFVTSWKELDWIFNYQKISDDPEDYEYCIAKQQCVEIECCQSRNLPYYYLLHAKEMTGVVPCEDDQIREYDYQLCTSNKWKINCLKENKFLLRTNCFEIAKPLEYLQSVSGCSVLSWQDDLKVRKWYDFVSSDFTKRRVRGIFSKDINEQLLKGYADNNNKVFIKTRNKDISFVTDIYLSDFEVRHIIENMSPEKPLIISEPLDFICDEKGSIEYYNIHENLDQNLKKIRHVIIN